MKLVELMCCLLAVLVHPCYTVDWYISVDRGSSDVNECGLSMGSPCSSIELILANISSTVITSDGTLCYQETTGSLFTSFYFLSGRYTLVPFCLMGWSNLVISGAEDASFDSEIGPNRGVIEIHNSTNISIANITFISSIVGRATLYVKDSTQVYISNGIFPVYAIGSNGIAFSNVYGTVVISHTVFKGNFFLTSWLDMEPASALRINQGFDILDSNFVPEVDIKPFDIEITNCTFERLGSSNDYRYTNSLNNYESTSSSATALLLQYTHSSINNRIVIEDSNFVKNVRLDGSVSIIRYSHDAYNNSAIFRNCRFENNKARYGGGIATYFIGSAEQNSLHVENCSFYQNEATFEGGGIFASSLVLKADSRIIVKGCEFVDNKALYGAGVFVFNDPNWSISNFTFISSSTRRLIPVHLTDCHFINCSCSFSEGVINVLKSHFSLKGSNLFTGNYGSSVVLRSSIMVANGNTLFSRNKASHGGGLKILLNSLVDFLYVENFTFSSNTAMSFGGAIYADSSSSTVTADVYNHSLAAGSLGNCFILFPSSKESLIYFINNTAVISGNDFHVFNLRSCSQGYFIPNPLQMCFPNVQNNPVAIETDTPFLSTSTGPSYLYFYGSSTGCYKPVGDIIYKLPNCTSDILKDTFFGLSQLVCGVEAIKQNELSLLAGPGGALTPPPNNLVLPWAGIGISWTANPGNERSQCIEQVPSNLILSPSPGEAFGLTIQLADQLLNFITGTVFIQVNSNGVEPPGVLLQLNGLQYAYTDRIYFTPNRPLTGLALVGLPGTSGHLNIVSESQILGEAIVLQIPFILSQCPLGYFDPPGATNIDEVSNKP
jgi:predicted outer membrane repeat protein